MKSEPLIQFMLELCKEPAKVEAIRRNPNEFLLLTKLSQEEKDIIKSCDQYIIQQAIDPEMTTPFGGSPGPAFCFNL